MAHIHNVHRMSDKDPVRKPEDYLKKESFPTPEELKQKMYAAFRQLKAN